MASLLFIVPAHGRLELSSICLAQLRVTCDALIAGGIDASAIVVAEDENLAIAHANGFWGYEQDNRFLGRKFNDGYEFAHEMGFDFCVPLGSDDWIHPSLFLEQRPELNKIRCARRLVMVDEAGTDYMRLRIGYEGGIGMRIIPTDMLRLLNYRPADEDRKRAVDTSTLRRIVSVYPGLKLDYYDTSTYWQIVDFKTEGANLNSWQMCLPYLQDQIEKDPWPCLYEWYEKDLVDQMRELYRESKKI